jgi:hypothetical protein
MPTYRVPGAFEVDDDMDWQTPYLGPSDPFMVENEDLKSQLTTQNPWRTLIKYRNPLKPQDLGLYSRFPLLRLPAEILLVVAEYLPAESVACLVLACKATNLALGTGSFKMSKPDLWKFLLLIEPERANSYACSRCLTLHRPPESFGRNRYRCCLNRNWRQLVGINLHLPDSITPGLVKMIARKYFEDPRACQEYLSWAVMSTKKTTRYIKLATHVIPRMLEGSLVLRTETYIHAFVDGHLTERSLMELGLLIRGGPHLPTTIRVPDLCRHQEWKSHLTNIATLKEFIKPTKCGSDTDNHYHRTRCYSNEKMMRTTGQDREYPIEMCDLIHEQPCKTWKLQVPSTRTRSLEDREAREACRPKLADTYDGEIKGCRKCITDFCVSAREVPGLGYCLVLTTWKDLGGVGISFSDKWDRHVGALYRIFQEDHDDIRSEDQVGQAYEAFEDLERSYLGTPQPYRPQPDRKMIRDLNRRVQKYSHRQDDTTDTEAGTEIEGEDEGDL